MNKNLNVKTAKKIEPLYILILLLPIHLISIYWNFFGKNIKKKKWLFAVSSEKLHSSYNVEVAYLNLKTFVLEDHIRA